MRKRSPAAAAGAARPRPGAGSFSPLERPLYEQVKVELRRRIKEGLHGAGSQLPPEGELATAFRVSGITIRRAIRDLVIEGALVSRQGVGVFVVDRRRIIRSFRGDFNASLADDMRARGFEPSFQKVSLSLATPDPWVLDALGLRAARPVYRLERVILGNGEPVCLDVNYFTRKLTDTLVRELSTEFMLPVLVAHGATVDYIDYRIEGGAAAEDEAYLLRLPGAYPVLKVHYTPIDPGGATIITGVLITRADRFAYDFCVHPGVDHGLHGNRGDHARGRARRAAPRRPSPPAE